MGYRSEVLLALSPKAAVLLSTYIARGGAIAELLSEESCDTIDKEEDGQVTYHWNGIKWYESYPEIAAVQEFMSRLEEENMDDEYRFVRVGEDTDDNEVRGWGFEIGISRTIEWY